MTNFVNEIKKAALRGEQLYMKVCTVDSYNETDRTVTCAPYDDSAQLTDVQLQSVSGNKKGFLMVPKTGSDVLVGYLDRNNAAVILYSDIERFIVAIGDSKLDIKEDKIIFNEGENGAVKIEHLVERLNNIEKLINNHVHQYVDSVAGTLTTSAIIDKIMETIKSDLEDTKLLHS